ncbi:MAG: TonB-dependent receptor plug domain-containing protein [Chlorobi bacterium]|nr:TonB-dependent receptor plug domain-containing protein [Chlorobiota bacterium]
MICLSMLPARAQLDEPGPDASDSTLISQPEIGEGKQTSDSIPLFLPHISPPGSLKIEQSLLDEEVAKYDVPDRVQFTLLDPLSTGFPSYQLRGGELGFPSGFSTAGADPAAHEVLFNGRPLRGAKGRAYDLALYPLEFVESVEFLQGSRAVLYGHADALSGVNILQPRFDVEGSYLRLAFSQGAGATSRAEGIFARNLSRKSNLAIGFRRLVSDGVYANQEVDGVNLYSSLYHRSNPGLAFSVTGMLTEFDRGASGGLKSPSDPTSTGADDVINDTLDNRVLRHDLTLAVQWIPSIEGGERTSDDTITASGMTRFDGSFYVTHAEDKQLVGEELAELSTRPSLVRGDLFGMRGSGITWFGPSKLRSLMNAEVENASLATLHGGLVLTTPLTDRLDFVGGGAVTSREDLNRFSVVGELHATLTDSSVLRATYRYSLGEKVAMTGDTLQRLSGEQTLWIADLEWGFRDGVFNGRFNAWLRQGIKVNSLDMYSVSGLIVKGQVPIGFARLKATINGTLLPEEDKRYPVLATSGELFAPLMLFNGALDLDFGVDVAWQSDFSGVEYDPISGHWLYPTERRNAEREHWMLIDLFVSARIGSAYLNLSFYNLLNAEYRTLSRYPTWGRSLRFGITWGMID